MSFEYVSCVLMRVAGSVFEFVTFLFFCGGGFVSFLSSSLSVCVPWPVPPTPFVLEFVSFVLMSGMHQAGVEAWNVIMVISRSSCWRL